MVTSWIDDVTIREQHGKLSLDTLVAKQCKQTQVRLRSFAKIGFRKAVQGYNKMVAIITMFYYVNSNSERVYAFCTART